MREPEQMSNPAHTPTTISDIGVAMHARLQAIEGVSAGDIMGGEGLAPRIVSIEDPDGNHIWVVQSA
jgi:hypothetical protein